MARTMRAFVCFLICAISISTAYADNELDCPQLAEAFKSTYFAFPEIVPGSVEQFAAWRASCVSGAPAGAGNVVSLCQADLPEGGHVFYWLKVGVDVESSGYEICEY